MNITIATVGLIVAGFSDTRLPDKVLRKEAVVPAPLAAVWNAWTTAEGIRSFLAEDAKIELTPGGPYEIYFSKSAPAGQRGADGCTVLTFVPYEMLAFTWNATPSIPKLRDAQVKTQVVLTFTALGPDKTRIQLAQYGFGEGEDWQKYYDYFDGAWGKVMSWATEKIRGDAIEVPKPAKTWQQGPVTVAHYTTPEKRQDFTIELPASTVDVFRTLTTPEGVRTFYPGNPVIELKPGGKWDLRGGKPNRVLAFVPNEMFAATGSAPPQFPEVQKGGHWGVFTLESLGEKKTRLRLTVVGWREGQEWDDAFNYFLKANADFLGMLNNRFVDGPRASND